MTIIIVILLAILGSALGSFFNVLIYRLPRKESIIFPASHCGECGKAIPFYLNIPIFSYLILGGKCKYCRASIHWHHLLVEVITPLVLIALFYQYGLFNIMFLKYAILCLVMIPIFFIDAFHQIIPHPLSISLIPIGLIFALIPGNDVGIAASGLGAGIMFTFLVILAYMYRFLRKADGLGGGDIWLLTGVGAFFGLMSMPFVVLTAALLGIIYFIIFIRSKDKQFAFGTFIAIATIFWAVLGADRILNFLFPI